MKGHARRLRCVLMILLVAVFGVDVSAVERRPSVGFTEVFVSAPDELPRAVRHDDGILSEAVPAGSVVYFTIEGAGRAEDLKGMRALTGDWESGEGLVGRPRIEYRMMYGGDGREPLGYRYVVALPVVDRVDPGDFNVSGRVGVGERWSQALRVSFSFVVRRDGGTAYENSLFCKETSSLELEFEPSESELSLVFADFARFVVDVQGQGKVDVGFSSEPFTDIITRYPSAALRFLYWNSAPIFNRVGELLIYAREDEQLYELTDNGLRALPAPYSKELEAYVVSTRRLGSYVLSDRELGAPDQTGARPNPPTGRRDFVERTR